MKYALVVLVVLLAPTLEAAVAPFFPLRGAQPNVALIILFGIAVAGGPRLAMGAIAPLALLVAFQTGRPPALVLAGYLPLLPLGYLIEGGRVPLNAFARAIVAVLATGGWARLMLSLGAFSAGATFSIRELGSDVLISGAILDLVLLSVVYLPLRLTGVSGRSLSPSRTGWYQ